MSSKKSEHAFIGLYLTGEALAEEIDDYIDAWHAAPGGPQIYAYLGMSQEEYSLWLREPEALPQIAVARRQHRPLTSVISSALNKMSTAALSSDAMKVQRLKQWLEMHGKIE